MDQEITGREKKKKNRDGCMDVHCGVCGVERERDRGTFEDQGERRRWLERRRCSRESILNKEKKKEEDDRGEK